jgi:hypothetical protein
LSASEKRDGAAHSFRVGSQAEKTKLCPACGLLTGCVGFHVVNSDAIEDGRRIVYRLVVKYGAQVLACAWECPKTLIYQILEKSVGSTWLREAAVKRVKGLGARELARRAEVPVRQVLYVLDGGEISEPLRLFLSRHGRSKKRRAYYDTRTNEGLN